MSNNQNKTQNEPEVCTDIQVIQPSQTSLFSPVMPVMTPQQAKEAWNLYEQIKAALLSEADWQDIAGKKYIKRSGFRKIAVAFGISDRILSEERVDRQEGSFVWRIKVEVAAPNGRTAVGVGACDSTERKFAHAEHDVYSTAHTRAKSRAISDLVAGGALSAEEINSNSESPFPPQATRTTETGNEGKGWQPMPPTTKGPWEKNTDLLSDEVQYIIANMDAENKTYIETDEAAYWQITEKDLLAAVGRRLKK